MHETPLEIIRTYQPWLVKIRRQLHQIPEPGDAEFETADSVCQILETLKIPYTRKRTSIIALIEGTKPGKTVAIRADMDALPVDEPENRPYVSSHKGYMHACGHDAHMTCALGAARYFAEHRKEFSGAIKLLFQPAEETTGGAETMIKEGCLENPHVDAVIGLHVQSYIPVGKIEVKYDALNGSSDYLKIIIKGRGAHAAYPDTGIDAIVIAANVMNALQTIVSRSVSPLEEAVLTIGTIEGGKRNNILADEVTMTGTIRTTNPEVRADIARKVTTLVQSVSQAFGGTGSVEIIPSYMALINHNWVVDIVAEEAQRLLGKDSLIWKSKPSLGVEDFSFFLKERPGAFYHLGCGNPEKGITAPLHARDFDIDESCLPIGSALHVAVAQRLLIEGNNL